MIRVAAISPEPTPYRAPLFDLISDAEGIDLTVFYAARTVARRQWSVDLHHKAVFLEGPTLPTVRLIRHDYPITPGLWRQLDRGEFDSVVIFGWSVFASQLAVAWARRRRVPYLLVSESHEMARRPIAIRAVKRLVLPTILRPAAGHLVTGSSARRLAIEYGADPARIAVFANTVDTRAFGAEADRIAPNRDRIRSGFGLREDSVAVLHCGSLVVGKGVGDLVEAAALARSNEAAPIALVFAGDGPERQRLGARAAELGVPASFLGFLSGPELVQAYVAADIFALLSHEEPWGVVVNEAAACGLPLVLSDRVGAAPDLLAAGRNGELVAAGDVAAAASALARLAREPDVRRAAGEESRRIAAGWGYGPSRDAFVEAVRRAVGVAS